MERTQFTSGGPLHRRIMDILELHGAELYGLLVHLTLRAEVAGELMQELFVRLAESKAFGRAEDGWAYVRRAAINLAFDWRRRQARGRVDGSVVPEPIDPAPPPWLRLARREQAERILALAMELPGLAREAFVLRYVHAERYETIGRALGRTPHQARGLCHAALQELRRRLAPIDVEVFHE